MIINLSAPKEIIQSRIDIVEVESEHNVITPKIDLSYEDKT